MLDKNFKCPKSIKMLCACRPKRMWRMHMEAHAALLQHERNTQKRRAGRTADE